MGKVASFRGGFQEKAVSLLDAMCPVASRPSSLNMGLHLVKGDGNFRTEKKRGIPVIALFDMK